MSHPFNSNDHGFLNQLPHQLPNPQRPTRTYSHQVNGLPAASYPTSLPPIHAHNAPSEIPAIQQLQPSALNGSQPTSFPAYAPTSNIHYHHDIASSPATPGRTQYASAAPSNFSLPKLQPAPTANGDLRQGYDQERADSRLGSPSAQETSPKHVVGSQGRRGILPSVSGRPPALTSPSANGSKTPPTVNKDGDGKYPCPHCNKPYLHAKHLKRHMLRRKLRYYASS